MYYSFKLSHENQVSTNGKTMPLSSRENGHQGKSKWSISDTLMLEKILFERLKDI